MNRKNPKIKYYLSISSTVAFILFINGCIEPLTPSEGKPFIKDILLYFFLPALLVLMCFLLTKSTIFKIVLLVEELFILILGIYILNIHFKFI